MGRGSSGIGNGWKSQLAKSAKKGEMPAYIMGNREQQAEVFEEIDKLYSMPDTKKAKIADQGASVFVQMNGKVFRSGYPSGENASEEEKRGVLKWILYNRLKG